MPSTVRDAEYDANLLASAPKATKEQLQSGYTTDLLKPKPKSRRTRDLEAGQVDQKNTESSPAPSKIAPVPFYRSRKGIIVISIVVIVVLGAVIGGAVGATQGKKAHAVPDSSGQYGQTQSATSATSAIPSSSVGDDQKALPSKVPDLVPASWQRLGVPA